MRLDARKGDRPYMIWHVPTCREIPRVVWIDDVTCEYATISAPARVVAGEVAMDVRKAHRIEFLLGQRMVLVDPLEDGESAADSSAVAAPVPAGVPIEKAGA